MTRSRLSIYPGPGDVDISSRVEREVRRLCHSRKTARGLNRKRVSLSGKMVDELVANMIHAASHAAICRIDNRVRKRGAQPDNSRIILARDVRKACSALGLSPGLRFAPPESFAVDLFNVVAPI